MKNKSDKEEVRTENIYIAIDLKSFYASVECVDRNLDPLTANLVVADETRTEKTICLAVSPALKAHGIPGRARLFEVIQRVRDVNLQRKYKAPGHVLSGKSSDSEELKKNPSLELDYIVAPPRMARYMAVSTKIYQIYCRHISPEDIHVYSIDEVFIDAAPYLKINAMTPEELTMTLIREVLKETGITATAGIGTNLYLAKIAMDIVAKKMPADKNGVRMARLDELSYRRQLWDHRPLTDFWRVGRGTAKKLEDNFLYTMGDVARCSLADENKLYKLFGVNAELLIDHAWGWEPCTIAAIRSFRPETNSISSGQVLKEPYEFEKARLIVREMTDLLVLDLVRKRLTTDRMELNICYDVSNIWTGEKTTDWYGRTVPKPAHGAVNLSRRTSSARIIMAAVTELYEKIVNRNLSVRKIYVIADRVEPERLTEEETDLPEQMDLFTDYAALSAEREREKELLRKERSRQEAVLSIKNKYGKNAILKGMNFEEGATAIERNGQVGGHRA